MSDYGHDEAMADLGLDPAGDHRCINCDGLPKSGRMRCIGRWPTHSTKYRGRVAAYIERLEAELEAARSRKE